MFFSGEFFFFSFLLFPTYKQTTRADFLLGSGMVFDHPEKNEPWPPDPVKETSMEKSAHS